MIFCFKGHWQRKFLLAISILLDNLTMKILSFPSRTFYSRSKMHANFVCRRHLGKNDLRRSTNFVTSLDG